MGDLIKLYDENGERVGTYCIETGRAQIGTNFFVVERACRIDRRVPDAPFCYECAYDWDDDWNYCPNCGARVVEV